MIRGIHIKNRQQRMLLIVGIFRANRSPDCGVDATSDNNEETGGMGLFIEGIPKGDDRGV